MVGEVQETHQSLFVPAVLQHRHALPVHRVVGVHHVHPVAAVVKVCPGKARHAKEVLVAQRDGGKRHAVRPHHIDLRDDGEGEEVKQAVPGPDEQKHQADADRQKPEEALGFGFVRRKNVPQPVHLGSEHERQRDLCDVGLSVETHLLFSTIVDGFSGRRERHHSVTGSQGTHGDWGF